MAATVETQLDGLASRFDTTVTTVAETWTTALAQHERTSDSLSVGLRQSQEAFAETFAQRSAALLATVQEAHATARAELAAKDQEQLTTLTQALEAMAASLQQEWQQAGAQTLAQQEQICQTLGETAREISATAQAQASHTIDEVTRLMQSAAEAPRAAAEVIGQLRQELSASMAQQTPADRERSRIRSPGASRAINRPDDSGVDRCPGGVVRHPSIVSAAILARIETESPNWSVAPRSPAVRRLDTPRESSAWRSSVSAANDKLIRRAAH